MEDLIDWLKAQLTREEGVANAAQWSGDERWLVLEGQEQPFHRPWQVLDDRDYGVAQTGIGGAVDPETLSRHIALWDPVRVLDEIAAKRRIIAEIERTLAYEDHGHALAREVLHQMVVPYADCEGFMQIWRP